jgi:hypothetical protein
VWNKPNGNFCEMSSSRTMRTAINGAPRMKYWLRKNGWFRAGRARKVQSIPFRRVSYQFQNEALSDEQRRAVLHVLHSADRVTAIRGGAGTGKTMMMKEAVAAIESGGHRVFTFAPSAEASRGVLRSEAGFANAETVEALLQSAQLRERIRGR